MLTDEEMKGALDGWLLEFDRDPADREEVDKFVAIIREAERGKGEASSLWSEPGRLTAEAGEFLDAHMMELWPWASTLCSAHQIPDPECPTCNRSRRPTPYADKVLEVARDVLRSGLLVKLNEKTTLAGIMELAKECAVILITAANEASMKREGGNRD